MPSTQSIPVGNLIGIDCFLTPYPMKPVNVQPYHILLFIFAIILLISA